MSAIRGMPAGRWVLQGGHPRPPPPHSVIPRERSDEGSHPISPTSTPIIPPAHKAPTDPARCQPRSSAGPSHTPPAVPPHPRRSDIPVATEHLLPLGHGPASYPSGYRRFSTCEPAAGGSCRAGMSLHARRPLGSAGRAPTPPASPFCHPAGAKRRGISTRITHLPTLQPAPHRPPPSALPVGQELASCPTLDLIESRVG